MPNRRHNFYKRQSKQKSLKAFLALLGIVASFPAYAQQEISSVRPYQPRLETNIRAGTERTILMTEAWVPLAQELDRVLYGDVRLMGDDGDNREWNFGIGYRGLNAPGDAVLGVHGWFDRRRSTRGSVFHQVAGGVEYLSSDLDVRLNGYIPFNEEQRYTIAGGSTTPYLADTGIFYDTNGLLVEKPLHGFDVELSLPVKALENTFDSFRVSAGGFAFSGNDVETLRGVRLRAAADVTPDLQIGARFETDNQRGAQVFAEATLRFPFGSKASNRTLGLRSRLDESPERDIDVITSAKVAVAATQRNAVTSAVDGQEQRVFHVDNTAAAGGDGSLSNPFNTLAAANTAADRAGDIIYLNRGDGTTAGQNQGVTLAHQGQALIGSGVDFVYDGTRFTAGSGTNFSGTVLRTASIAPLLSNVAPASDAVRVTADDVLLTGFDVIGSTRDGVAIVNSGGIRVNQVSSNSNSRYGLYAYTENGITHDISLTDFEASNNSSSGVQVEANLAGVWNNVTIQNVITNANSGRGIFVYAQNGGQISDVELTSISSNNNTGASGSGIEIRSQATASTVSSVIGRDISANQNNVHGFSINALSGQVTSVDVENMTVSNNVQSGANVYAQFTSQINDVSFNDLTANSNGLHGILMLGQLNGRINNSVLENITANSNTQQGVYIYAQNNGRIGTAELRDITASSNIQRGIWIFAQSGQINDINISDVVAESNRQQGIWAYALGGTISSVNIQNATSINNLQQGVYIYAQNGGGVISQATLSDIYSENNSQQGLYIQALSSGSVSASLERVTVTGNGTNGIYIDDETTASFVADLGGGSLGSTGANRIFGNTGTDLRLDLDGLELKAENNWWGSAAGLLPGQLALEVGSGVDFAPWLVADPQ